METGLIEYVNYRINKPWSKRFHCWALVKEVQQKFFGRMVPKAKKEWIIDTQARAEIIETHPDKNQWQKHEQPIHGAVTFMRRKGTSKIIHAGVYLDIDGGGILHVDAPHGVVFDSLPILTAIRQWQVEYWIR